MNVVVAALRLSVPRRCVDSSVVCRQFEDVGEAEASVDSQRPSAQSVARW